ncbi:MAG: hypothetical protein EPN43_04945 [Jatrophihabitans sp.]|nr:MAG: hypothetical protein EPN43_04945 [Jatrophihabitans sp.]
MRLPLAARGWYAALALLVLAAFVLQLKIALDVPGLPPRSDVGTLAGASAAGRVVRVLSFFTIQSNLLCVLAAVRLAWRPGRPSFAWSLVHLDALLGITVTGIVYSTVLARVHEPRGWAETATNAVFHYAAPIAMVLGWLVFGPRPRLTARLLATALVWPLAWFGYTLLRGAIWGWYPYPFVSVPAHGYGVVVLNALAVTAVLALVAVLFGWGGWLGPRGGSARERPDYA